MTVFTTWKIPTWVQEYANVQEPLEESVSLYQQHSQKPDITEFNKHERSSER